MNPAVLLALALLYLSVPSNRSAPSSNAAPRQKEATHSMPDKSVQAPAVRLFNPPTMFKPTAGYSQVAEVTSGKTVYIAGQIALDAAGNLVGKDDFHAQVKQIFENLRAAVEAAGGNFHDVVKINYYCAESVDPAQIVAVRDVRDTYVDTANPPASTFVFVKRLVRPEWMIEIEAVAVVKQ